MKKNTIFNVLVVLGFGLAISSCASTNATSSNGIFNRGIHSQNGTIASHKKVKHDKEDVAKVVEQKDIKVTSSQAAPSREEIIREENTFAFEQTVKPTVIATDAVVQEPASTIDAVQTELAVATSELQQVAHTPASVVATSENQAKVDKQAFKSQVKDLKKELKASKSSAANSVNPILLAILCIFLPFIAVLLVHGVSTPFWIDLLLCILFYLPGIIYAFIVCF